MPKVLMSHVTQGHQYLAVRMLKGMRSTPLSFPEWFSGATLLKRWMLQLLLSVVGPETQIIDRLAISTNIFL